MSEKCKGCGRELFAPNVTYCSDECLFKIVSDAESLSEIPIRFKIDSEPWI